MFIDILFKKLSNLVGGFIPKDPTRTKPGFIESLYITTEEPIKAQTAYKGKFLHIAFLANF